MVVFWLLIGFAFAAFVVRVPARWLGIAALAIWLAVLGVHLSMPGGAVARAIGGSFAGWLVGGAVLGLVLGYRLLLRGLSRRAGGGQASDPVAVPEAVPVVGGDRSATMSDDELDRYARHIVLREIGGPGQMRLRGANVLLVGAGGLGAPLALYLAAAGVGRITLADDDSISLSNLQRQVLFRSDQTGQPKAQAGAAAMGALNPHVTVTPLMRRVAASDAALVAGHDLVLDGTDSFAARAAVNAACVEAGVPLLAGAIAQWEGQATLYDPARGGPCMACIFPVAPAAGLAPSCAEAGVVGALPGVIGSVMALEAIKHLTGAGQGLRGRMLIFDGLYGETRTIGLTARADCPVCGGRGA
ncbi:molybdopterin-synthase adenylyltransferase MoeB [Paracoccus sp. M683]|uniref:HesA/MoeB/ThiF family protein n=1 Tax=Paracoccus sp. M683 TaxID=2594268 RepID=UPI001180360A|nr:molybdopterin-synthase adenylyltransferase MoeB [Paracoccus sp. M683]TRW98434.1 molybdopterin-synthase adenylyltransferase MoeB [Paracoccus sp. M683]